MTLLSDDTAGIRPAGKGALWRFALRRTLSATPAALPAAMLMIILVACAQGQSDHLPSPAPAPQTADPVPTVTISISLDSILSALVERLDSTDYQIRERSSSTLHSIGPAAAEALAAAARSDSPEVRMRAERLLRDLRLGITPEWPGELALLARHYDRLNEKEQLDAISRIVALHEKAAPFLAARLRGQPTEAHAAAVLIVRSGDPRMARAMVAALGEEPADGRAEQVLIWARPLVGQLPDPALVLEDFSAHLKMTLTETVKEQTPAGFQQAMAGVSPRIIVTTPTALRGWRMLDDLIADVSCDVEARTLHILLNGRRVANPVPLQLPDNGHNVDVAIEALDCVYLYRVDMASGKVLRLQRFEKDYLLTVSAEGPLAEIKDVSVAVGSTVIQWSDLAGGYLLDTADEDLTLHVKGTLADGRSVTITGLFSQMVLKPAETAEITDVPEAESPRQP